MFFSGFCVFLNFQLREPKSLIWTTQEENASPAQLYCHVICPSAPYSELMALC